MAASQIRGWGPGVLVPEPLVRDRGCTGVVRNLPLSSECGQSGGFSCVLF